MSHDEPRLQLHAYLKSLSGYRGAPLHVDLCFYVCNPKNCLNCVNCLNTPALRARGLHTRERRSTVIRAAGDSPYVSDGQPRLQLFRDFLKVFQYS